MLKTQLAGSDGVAGSMCLDELHNGEWSSGRLPGLAEGGEPMKRKISYETLEGMTLESLLYYVLVGEGKYRNS